MPDILIRRGRVVFPEILALPETIVGYISAVDWRIRFLSYGHSVQWSGNPLASARVGVFVAIYKTYTSVIFESGDRCYSTYTVDLIGDMGTSWSFQLQEYGYPSDLAKYFILGELLVCCAEDPSSFASASMMESYRTKLRMRDITLVSASVQDPFGTIQHV
jgi:hypothetical protein